MQRVDRLHLGFTLLEVLVALSIFAISLLAVTKAIGQGTHSLLHVEDKTFAHWVARNAMGELLLGLQGPISPRQTYSGQQQMGHREYEWQATVQSSGLDLWTLQMTVKEVGRAAILSTLSIDMPCESHCD